ncbi:hypothetical protein H5410_014133 [Solanum commersonii]|uniref:Uncharacterized protein n=1 Tax=Solanum commersonii TaxID=4109 RepID=A0A9J5ZQ21_SOLCO|nr:hypothetical protein H5410_014133 [Solanum commersonii]
MSHHHQSSSSVGVYMIGLVQPFLPFNLVVAAEDTAELVVLLVVTGENSLPTWVSPETWPELSVLDLI